jgi:hypothetical protein
MRGCDCEEDEDDVETSKERRLSELEKVRYLGQALEAIQKAIEQCADQDQDLTLNKAVQKVRKVREALRAPVLWCEDCGYEWDGRRAPIKGQGCNHAAMWSFWSDIQRTGVTRGEDEPVDQFVRCVKDTVYGILPRSARTRS